jgi:lipoprotein-anchoring transpeptidase ErfK/SrfK
METQMHLWARVSNTIVFFESDRHGANSGNPAALPIPETRRKLSLDLPKILLHVMLISILAFAPTRHTLAEPFDFSNFRDDGSPAFGSEDSTQLPSRSRKNYRPRQYPALMSGGPRPQVLPKAPKIITFPNKETAGTVIVINRSCRLYYILSPTKAYEYPISIGRLGFTWTGTEKISRMVDWPDWTPPPEMLQRQPGLPRKMTGGLDNPLGVRALYLGASLYRIHGTNNARTIGHAASSGCFRMMNEQVMHLSGLVHIGTKVKVIENWPVKGVVGVRQGAQQVCGAEIPVDQRQRQRQSVTREGRGLGLLGVLAPWRW